MKTILVLCSLYFSSTAMGAASNLEMFEKLFSIVMDGVTYVPHEHVSSDEELSSEENVTAPLTEYREASIVTSVSSSSSSSSADSEALYEQLFQDTQDTNALDRNHEFELILVRPQNAQAVHAEVILNNLLYVRPYVRNLEIRIHSNEEYLPQIMKVFRNTDTFQEFINQNTIKMNRLRNRIESIRISVLHLEALSEFQREIPVHIDALIQNINNFMNFYGNSFGKSCEVSPSPFGYYINFTFRFVIIPPPLNLNSL